MAAEVGIADQTLRMMRVARTSATLRSSAGSARSTSPGRTSSKRRTCWLKQRWVATAVCGPTSRTRRTGSNWTVDFLSPADHLTDARLGKRDRHPQDQAESCLAEAYTRVGSGESSPISGLFKSVQEKAEKLLLELKPTIFFASN